MCTNEMINSLDSLSSSKSYSKNGNLFEQIIKYRSLRTLVNKLKHPIKICKLSFLEKFNLKYPYDSTTLGIPDEYLSDSIYKLGKKDKYDQKELIIPKKDNKGHKFIIKDFNFQKKKNYDYINSNPFKYHPNYNAIHKNVQTTKFFLPSKEYLLAKNKKNKIKIHKNLLILNNNLNEPKNIPLIINEVINHDSDERKNDNQLKNKMNNNNKEILNNINNFPNTNNENFCPNISHIIRSKIIKNSKSEGNLYINNINISKIKTENHQRKLNLKNNNNNILSTRNYINDIPTKQIKTIDFAKMKPHSLKYLINTNILKNPSICYYKPNYDAFIKKNYVIFNTKNPGKKNKSLQKIWSCYDVRKEYMSIDNEKLNEGITKKLFEIKVKFNN